MENYNMANLREKKLSVIGLLIVVQFACIFIGGLFSLQPYEKRIIFDTVCVDNSVNCNFFRHDKLYYPGGNGSCQNLDSISELYYHDDINQNVNVIHTFQIPLSINEMEHSKYHQNLVGALKIDNLKRNKPQKYSKNTIIMDVKLAYRNKGDPNGTWHHVTSTRVKRFIDCSLDKYELDTYHCETIPLFDLSDLYHDYYLLNIHFLFGVESNIIQESKYDSNLSLSTITQDEGFMKILLGLRTVFFPIILIVVFWYWNRVTSRTSSPNALEFSLLWLGFVMSFFDLPSEYASIHYEVSVMSFNNDIKHFVLYFGLLSFWIIFVVEHSKGKHDSKRNAQKYYSKNLGIFFIGFLSIFLISIYERFVQLDYPFYLFWMGHTDTYFTILFNCVVGFFFGSFLYFLSKTIWIIFQKIECPALPNLKSYRQSQYDESVYRLKGIMIATLFCATLTVLFMFYQVMNHQWKWNEKSKSMITSEYLIGINGMWNIYTISLLYLYAPKGKKTMQQHSKEELICTIYSP